MTQEFADKSATPLDMGPGAMRRSIFFLCAAIACVLAIWLPFGFSLIGLIEEWQELGLFALHGPNFFPDLVHPTSDALRPLTHVPFALAYTLGPDSFISWHFLLIGALVLKGWASSQLVFRVTGSTAIAVIAGLLVVVYPADTMQLAFRGLHICWSLSLALTACALLMAAWDSRNRRDARTHGVAAAITLLVAVLMYEAALTYFIVPLALVFARDGLRGFLHDWRQRIGPVLLWAAACGIYVVYATWMSRKVVSYQATLLNGQDVGTVLMGALPKLFSVGESRAILGGWYDAVRMVVTEYRSYVYLSLASLVLGLMVIAGDRLGAVTPVPPPAGKRAAKVWRLLLVGLILTAAGYLPYLFSAAHLSISQRTFLFASPGAVFLWTALLWAVSFKVRHLANLAGLVLVFFGLGAQLVQFDHYVSIAETQRRLLRSIVENFDGDAGDKTLVIVDGSNYLGGTWMFIPVNLQLALEYFNMRPLHALEVCHATSMEWEETDQSGRRGACIETESAWVFRHAPNQAAPAASADLRVPKAQAVVLRIGSDGTVAADARLDAYRTRLRSGQDASSRRYLNVLAQPEWNYYTAIFGDNRPADQLRWSFGRWWSMDLPVRGFGWREAEWSGGMLRHEASAWKTDADAGILFDLAPAPGVYRLHVKFEVFTSEEIRQSLHISLNDFEVTCRWTSGNDCEADVVSGLLRGGTNEIRFSSLTDPKFFGLSAKLVSFELAHRDGNALERR